MQEHETRTATTSRLVRMLGRLAIVAALGPIAGADAGAQVSKAQGDASVPVPRSRPERPDPSLSPRPEAMPAPAQATIPVQNVPAFNLDEAKACEAELRKLGARFKVLPDIKGEAICGVQRPVVLTGIGREIAVAGSPKLNCATSLAVAKWAKHVVAPVAKLYLDAKLAAVNISTSYQCRRRNNAATGKFSEHAFGNGVDIMGFRFAALPPAMVVPRDGSSDPRRAFQAAVRGGACAYFTTVLGPGTNAAHDNHFHLDLAIRRGGFRLCE